MVNSALYNVRSLIVVASHAALFAISNSTSSSAASANQRANVSYASSNVSQTSRAQEPVPRTAFVRNAASCGVADGWQQALTVDWATDCDPGQRPYCAMRAGSRRPRTAATNPSRASAKTSPRGSSTCRARKNPVSANPSAISSSDGLTVSDRNAGRRNSRSCQGAAAVRDTARPDFGDT